MPAETDAGGMFKWTEDNYLWPANSPRPMNVRGLEFEAEKCMWCGGDIEGHLMDTYSRESHSTYFTGLRQCRLCGWYLERSGWYNHSVHCQEMRGYFNLLKKFRLDDEEVTVQELGSYLRSRFSDVYNISPRRLEQLVEDVFRNLGYRARLTQQTRDGGADVFLFDDGGVRQAIVEVKRYHLGHNVGVQLVRQLIGAQILLAARKGYLVTTSYFTDDAVNASHSVRLQEDDLEVELWDALRLLRELSCYNECILPIDSIKPDVPLYEQIPPELRAKKRLVRPPWPGFYGKRVSYLEGTDPPE